MPEFYLCPEYLSRFVLIYIYYNNIIFFYHHDLFDSLTVLYFGLSDPNAETSCCFAWHVNSLVTSSLCLTLITPLPSHTIRLVPGKVAKYPDITRWLCSAPVRWPVTSLDCSNNNTATSVIGQEPMVSRWGTLAGQTADAPLIWSLPNSSSLDLFIQAVEAIRHFEI